MKSDLLTLDPDLMQAVASSATASLPTRTLAQTRALQSKREAAIKADEKAVTRDQRRRDVTIKMLKPNEDALRRLRSLDEFNYFVVPYEMAKSVRAMIHRELSLSTKQYTTTKFKWGQRHYLKVKRVPEQ